MTLRLAPLALLLILSSNVMAERADRNKPMQLEASKVTIDDAKKIQTLEGDVLITKGTLMLKADRVVISEDAYGFHKGIAYGGKGELARFRQKREGKNEYMEGEAERIEYDSNSEVVELFHRAWVKNSDDQVRGDYIWYDAVNEKYLVTAGAKRDANSPPARVRAVLQPKGKDTEVPAPAEGGRVELRGASSLNLPSAQR